MFVGDSYGQGYTPNGQVKSWPKYTSEQLPIETSQRVITAHGGDGFGRSDSAYKFETQLQALSADSSVKYVVIGGGYNDIYSTESAISTGMSNCKTIIQSKFPNATMCIAFIGNTTDTSVQSNIATAQSRWASAATSLGVVNLANTNVLDDASLFSSDGIHPNTEGQQKIARAIVRAMNAQL